MVSPYTASHLPRPYRFPVSSVFPHRGSSFGEQSQGYQHATPACVLGWQEKAALQSARLVLEADLAIRMDGVSMQSVPHG